MSVGTIGAILFETMLLVLAVRDCSDCPVPASSRHAHPLCCLWGKL